MSEKSQVNKEYWEKNIEGFSGFYDTKSEETVIGNPLVTWLYKQFIFPIEKKYMFDRHKHVSNYILNNVNEGDVGADIGCGSGVYVLKMLERNVSSVFALDYANSAIELTKRNLVNEDQTKINYSVFDITESHIPQVNVAISIGVLPYIDDVVKYLSNILPYTDTLFFNFLDSNSLINRIRKVLGFLDVRKYSYHSLDEIAVILKTHNFELVAKIKLATGWMLEVKRINK